MGERLREARRQAGLRQRDLAFAGCTTAYISRIEAGARIPSLQILTELARKLDVSASYLATGDENGNTGLDPVAEAEFALRLDDPLTAREQFDSIVRTSSDVRAVARARAGLGHVAFGLGDHEVAIEHFEAALESWPELEKDLAIADSLGRAYALTARYEEAIAIFEPRLREAEERGDLIATIRFSVLLANTLVDRGRFGHAAELLGHALALAKESKDSMLRARLWWTQARLHTLQNNSALAERYVRLALAATQTSEHVRYSAGAFQTLALLKNDQGEPEEALELIDEGFSFALEGGSAFQQGLFRIEQARAMTMLGKLDDAEDCARRALELLEGGSPADCARALCILADIYEARGDHEKALAIYQRVVAEAPETGRYRVEAHAKLAALLRRAGRLEEALDVLTDAVSHGDSAVHRQQH